MTGEGDATTWVSPSAGEPPTRHPGLVPPPSLPSSPHSRNPQLPDPWQPQYEQAGYPQAGYPQAGYPQAGYPSPSGYPQQRPYLPPSPYAPPLGAPRPPRSRQRLVAWWVAGLTTLAVTIGLGAVAVSVTGGDRTGPGGGAASAGTAGGMAQQVQGLVLRMTSATRSQDKETFLTVFDTRDPDLRRRWAVRFDSLTSLSGSVTWEYRDPAAFAPPEAPDAPPGATVVTIDVVTTPPRLDQDGVVGAWQLPTSAERVPVTVAPVDGRWLIVADDDPARPVLVPHAVDALPWAAGPLRTAVRRGVYVVGDLDARSMALVADELEAALPEVRQVWSGPAWDGRVVAYAMADPVFRAEWLGGEAETRATQVVGLDGEGTDGSRSARLPRLIITPLLLEDGPERIRTQLRFELSYVARWTGETVDTAVPVWMDICAGDYTAARGPGERVSPLAALKEYTLRPTTLNLIRSGRWKPHLVVEGNGRDTVIDVRDRDDAFLTCLYIGHRFGDSALERLVTTTSEAVEYDAAVSEATGLKVVLKTDRARLAAAVAAWATRTLRTGTAVT